MKLANMPARLGTVGLRLQSAPGDRRDFDRKRDEQPWRKWYKTARWQKLRMSVLKRDRFTCQWPGCGRVEPDKSKLVADHRRPHRGSEQLFWDDQNLWCLCKPCHDGVKQRLEHRGGSVGHPPSKSPEGA